ncbi:MAG: zinc ribbon domain-containing protein, partial [Candidatus Aminicenantes bacterium]|nr:zinc ribbon domain-containing protein [Candidatus Aminicenantes bacterium]
MICTKCNQELPDDTKTCPYCGFQLQKKHPSQEKAAPDNAVLDSTNKTEKQFAKELKSKIKKSFYIKKDFNEAMNYIDLYLSMIGVDAEVIDYQQKILASIEQKEEPEEINSKEGLFKLEFETELSPPEDKPDHSNQQEPLPDKEALSLDSEEEIPELEDGISTADEFEKKSDFADKIVDDKSPVSDEKSWKQDEKDDRDDELLVLGPEEEILELEENIIEPDESAAEKQDTSDKKDVFSQFEIEINEPDKKKQSDIIPGEIPVSEFEKDMLLVPDSQPVKESEFEPQNQVEPGNIQSGTTDSVQTILSDLKEKKKKAFRWLFIGLSVIAFIILIIVLYILNAHSKNQDQTESSPPKTQEIAKEMNEDQGLSPLGKQYLEYLRSANDYFQKDDLKNAEHMINLAKKIKITDELVNLEKELKNKKAKQEIIKKIDSDDTIQPDNTEGIAFQKAINS